MPPLTATESIAVCMVPVSLHAPAGGLRIAKTTTKIMIDHQIPGRVEESMKVPTQ